MKENLQVKSIGDGAYEISPKDGLSPNDISFICRTCRFNTKKVIELLNQHLQLAYGRCSSLQEGNNAIFRLAEDTEGIPLKQVGTKVAENSKCNFNPAPDV